MAIGKGNMRMIHTAGLPGKGLQDIWPSWGRKDG